MGNPDLTSIKLVIPGYLSFFSSKSSPKLYVENALALHRVISMSGKKKKIYILLLILILLTGLALRLLTFYYLKKNDPRFNHISYITDSHSFYYTAKGFAQKKFLGTSIYHQTPFYSYFLAFIISTLGDSLTVIKVVQLISGTLLIIITYFLGKTLFNKTIGIIASFITAICPVFIYYETLILREFLVPLTLYPAILFFLNYIKQNKKYLLFLSGLFLSISFFVRPNALLLFPVFIFFLFYFKKIRHLLPFITGFIILFFLLIIRNFIVGVPALSFTSRGPVAFVIGNIYPSTGDRYYFPGNSKQILKSTDNKLKLLKKTLFSHPGIFSFIKLYMNKIYALFHYYEIPNNYDFYFYRDLNPLFYIPVNAGILVPLCFSGILLIFIRKESTVEINIFLILILISSISIIIFFVISRFRLPLYTFFIIFASYFIYTLKKIKLKEFIILFLTVIFIAYIVNRKQYLVNESLADAYCLLGNYYFYEENNTEKAVKILAKSLNYNRNLKRFYDSLTAIYEKIVLEYMKNNEYKKIVPIMERLIKIHPDNWQYHLDLGKTYLHLDHLEKAELSLEKAFSISNDNIEIITLLAPLYFKNKEFSKWKKISNEFIIENKNKSSAYYRLGKIYTANGMVTDAGISFNKSLEYDSSNIDALGELSIIELNNRNWDSAEKILKKIIKLDSANGRAYALIGMINFIKRKKTDAAAYLEKAIKYAPNDHNTINLKKMIAD